MIKKLNGIKPAESLKKLEKLKELEGIKKLDKIRKKELAKIKMLESKIERKLASNENVRKIEKKLLASEDPVPKTNYPFLDVLLAYGQLMRPFEWSKTLMNMVFGLLIAFYVYSAVVSIPIFVVGFVSVALLWAGLYALNDFTDWRADLHHPDKKFRPIPSGKISPKNAVFFAFDLIAASLLIGIMLGNVAFVGVLLVMMLNQLLYTTQPFKLKSRRVLDIISGSMVNPICRYFAGLLLFISAFQIFSVGVAVFPIILVIGAQMGSYLWYRFSSKEVEKKIDVKSSVAKASTKFTKRASRYIILAAVLSYFGLFINFVFFKDAMLGFLPPQYMLAIGVVIFGAPLAWFVRKNPKASTNKYFYAGFHIAAIIFSVLNLIVFLWMP